MVQRVNKRLFNWASEIDEQTLEQANRTARLPFVEGHVALMPDAHFGLGATVGSVIPTVGAIIPSAVGVDIGCGMIATQTSLRAEHLPDDLHALLSRIESVVPAGVGRGDAGHTFPDALRGHLGELQGKEPDVATSQLGSLGSGNHFVEVCLDEADSVWVVLHSGSRGVGNKIATRHIAEAKSLMKSWFIELPDPDLAYLVQSSPQFKAYIDDMMWAQDYAMANREFMMNAVLEELWKVTSPEHHELERVNCHHNFTQLESHYGKNMWITRKGAIKANVGDKGVIPGSMGTRSYIVQGKGNPLSFHSCSHGAGRRHSRTKARKLFTTEELAEQMQGKTWLSDRPNALLDEIPSAYKDIDQVMNDQVDLVEVLHTLKQVLNYKGT